MFRVWHYLCRIGVPVFLIIGILAYFVFQNAQVKTIGVIAFALLGLMGVAGAVLAVCTLSGGYSLACPWCRSKDTEFGGSKEEGMWIFCPRCGTTEESGFLKLSVKLNRDSVDPTLDWGEYRGMELVVVPEENRIGKLQFGDPLSAAEALGKPSSFEWGADGYCKLTYAQGGFQLDFEERRLVCAAFFLDHHKLEPEEEFTFAAPVVVLSGGERAGLSNQMKAADLVEIFGHPKEIDKDEDETILFFEASPVTMEFELRPDSHTLARWNLFPIVSDDE